MSNVSIIELSVRNWREEDYITFSLYCAPFLSLKPFKKREERKGNDSREEKENLSSLKTYKLVVKKENRTSRGYNFPTPPPRMGHESAIVETRISEADVPLVR